MDWQPIEAAPRDGTVIDLWVSYDDEPGGQRVPDGYYQREPIPWAPFDEGRTEGWAGANKGYDGCDGWADDPEGGSHVTHWMPLPEPPK